MTQYSKVKDKINYRWTQTNDTIRYVNFAGSTDIISSEISGTYRPNQYFRLKGSYAYYITSNSESDTRPHTFTAKVEYVEQPDFKYLPNVILSGKWSVVQISMRQRILLLTMRLIVYGGCSSPRSSPITL